MHSVRAYKMIFAVLERRLIQLLRKWLQFYTNNICCFINHFSNNRVIILLFVILNLVTISETAGELLRCSVFQYGGRPPSWILLQVKSDVTTRCELSMSNSMPNLVTIAYLK